MEKAKYIIQRLWGVELLPSLAKIFVYAISVIYLATIGFTAYSTFRTGINWPKTAGFFIVVLILSYFYIILRFYPDIIKLLKSIEHLLPPRNGSKADGCKNFLFLHLTSVICRLISIILPIFLALSFFSIVLTGEDFIANLSYSEKILSIQSPLLLLKICQDFVYSAVGIYYPEEFIYRILDATGSLVFVFLVIVLYSGLIFILYWFFSDSLKILQKIGEKVKNRIDKGNQYGVLRLLQASLWTILSLATGIILFSERILYFSLNRRASASMSPVIRNYLEFIHVYIQDKILVDIYIKSFLLIGILGNIVIITILWKNLKQKPCAQGKIPYFALRHLSKFCHVFGIMMITIVFFINMVFIHQADGIQLKLVFLLPNIFLTIYIYYFLFVAASIGRNLVSVDETLSKNYVENRARYAGLWFFVFIHKTFAIICVASILIAGLILVIGLISIDESIAPIILLVPVTFICYLVYVFLAGIPDLFSCLMRLEGKLRVEN